MIRLIAAVGRNMELGRDNKLLWRLTADMRFFRKMTLGGTIVMGRKTFESIGYPLPGRRNVVLSRDKKLKIPGVDVVHNINLVSGDDDCWVIGGANIYSQTINVADEIILTEIDGIAPDADVFFPNFNRENFKKTVLGRGVENGIAYLHARYTRIR